MGLPRYGQDSVTAVRRSAAEPNSPPAASALLRCIAKQLCRSPAPLAAPLVRRLHQPRRVQRPAEARLVQPSAEQKLVDLLQLRQREGGRQQMERDRQTDRAARPASSVRSRSLLAAGAAEAAGHPRRCHVAFPSTSSPVRRSTSARNATDSAAPDGCLRPPPKAPACSINEGAVPSVLLESSAASSLIVSSGRSDRHGSCHRSREPAGARSRSTMSRRPRGVRMMTSMDGAERRGLERVAEARAGMT